MKALLLFLALFFASMGIGHAAGADWYVDPVNGNNGNTGTDYQHAFLSPYTAAGKVLPGQTVCLMNTGYLGHFSISASSNYPSHYGTSSQMIYWKGCDANGNVITFGSDGFTPSAPLPAFNIEHNASTTIALQFKGNNRYGAVHPVWMTFSGVRFTATADNQHSGETDGSRIGDPITNTCGFNHKTGVGVETSTRVYFDHDEFFCSGGNGLDADGAQFVFIDHSKVWENAHAVDTGVTTFCVYGSGISYLRAYDWEKVTGVTTAQGDGTHTSSMITMGMTNNRIWNNYNDKSKTTSGHTCGPTDGNGVIYDRLDGSCENGLGCDVEFYNAGISNSDGAGGSTGFVAYRGWVDFSQNQMWSNGGGGFHLYLFNGKLTVYSNTSYLDNNRSTNVGTKTGGIDLSVYHGDTSKGGAVDVQNNYVYAGANANGKGINPCYADTNPGGQYQSTNVTPTFANNGCYDSSGTNGTGFHTASTSTLYWFGSGGASTSGTQPTIDPTVSGQTTGDPLFNSPLAGNSAADFTVKPASPALGHSVNTGTFLTNDILGVARVQSNYTYGAEQNSTSGGCTSNCGGGGTIYPIGTYGYTVTHDFQYGAVAATGSGTNISGNTADIYVPIAGAQYVGPYPAVFLVHGQKGNDGYAGGTNQECHGWVSYGFVCISVNYRELATTTSPAVSAAYPAPLVDVQLVARYFRNNASTYKIDPNNFTCKGDGFGATLCLMAGFYGTNNKTFTGDTNAGTLSTTSSLFQNIVAEYPFWTSCGTAVTCTASDYPATLAGANLANLPPTMIVSGDVDTTNPPSTQTIPIRSLLGANQKLMYFYGYNSGFEASGAAATDQLAMHTAEIDFIASRCNCSGGIATAP